ncbi:hypothetical protein COK05_17380 [Bacillus cereus]|uniref:Uncharacterized protein n=1 Tax=Bacillus cereus TaxID=1396 RepID=A0A2B2LI29_BACCE|nr:hypothetical protein COK05_17380 [Bacillus cereus]PGU09857.1 hypothetical protein COD21_17310 [Bacillus cereus]
MFSRRSSVNMLSPPLLKIQKFKLYVNYMHVSSVSQCFQSFSFRFYAGFSSLSISLTLTPNKCTFAYFTKRLLFFSLLL